LKSEHDAVKRRLSEQTGIVRQAIESGGGTHDNAMYDAALQEQQVLAQREAKLRQYLKYRVLEVCTGPVNSVKVGTRVRLRREDGEERVYTILGPPDVELSSDSTVISYLSPIGRQLIGREVGQGVMLEVPGGRYRVEVLEIAGAVEEG
jgi:transcription elongation factor GreA